MSVKPLLDARKVVTNFWLFGISQGQGIRLPDNRRLYLVGGVVQRTRTSSGVRVLALGLFRVGGRAKVCHYCHHLGKGAGSEHSTADADASNLAPRMRQVGELVKATGAIYLGQTSGRARRSPFPERDTLTTPVFVPVPSLSYNWG